jgi:hypothetical protein
MSCGRSEERKREEHGSGPSKAKELVEGEVGAVATESMPV